MKRLIRGLAAAVAVVTVAGCTTPTHRYAEGEARATVGAPVGAMNVVQGYPKGFNETSGTGKESIR